jgi:hypothetical protein
MIIAGIILAALLAIALPFTSSIFKIGLHSSKPQVRMDSGSACPVYIDEEVMRPKAHGTCEKPVMSNLRWNCDRDTADRICCFNRHYAEHSGYWKTTSFLNEVRLYVSDINQVILVKYLILGR